MPEPSGDPKRQRVVVIRTDHIGDNILFSGAWEPLRALFPDADIRLMGTPTTATLFAACPFIDGFLNYQDYLLGPWRRWPFGARAGLARWTRSWWLQKTGADVTLVPLRHTWERHTELIRCLNAPRSVGVVGDVTRMPPPAADDWRAALTERIELGAEHEWVGEREIAALFLRHLGWKGASGAELKPKVWLREEDGDGLAQALEPIGGAPYGVITPGGFSFKGRNAWAPERFGQTVAILGRRGPSAWVIDGAPNEKPLCHAVADAIRRKAPGVRVLNLTSSPLRRMLVLIQKAALMLATENAGVHLATAMGVPSVGIIGGWLKHRFHPWGDPGIHRIVMVEMDCWGCRGACMRPSVQCMEAISPERVAEECAAALEARTAMH